MPRKRKSLSISDIQTETARVKLEIEKIKLKTLEYNLKKAADKKRYLTEDAEHKKTMTLMVAKDDMVQEMIEGLVAKLDAAREENHKLRTSLAE